MIWRANKTIRDVYLEDKGILGSYQSCLQVFDGLPIDDHGDKYHTVIMGREKNGGLKCKSYSLNYYRELMITMRYKYFKGLEMQTERGYNSVWLLEMMYKKFGIEQRVRITKFYWYFQFWCSLLVWNFADIKWSWHSLFIGWTNKSAW